MLNVKTAQTKELVAFYNAHTEKKVKKFVNRATAELRVSGILNRLKAEAPKVEKAPAAGIPAWFEVEDKLLLADTVTAKRSVGVARSWMVEETAAKRKERSAVEVDGEVYGSVAKAFTALELPMNQQIKFRMNLKKEGEVEDEDGRNWKIIPLNY